MQPETVRYLIRITQEKRDQAASFLLNPNHSKQTQDHWHDELRRANDAYAQLARMPIA